MRQDAASVDVYLITNGDIVAEDGDVLETSPLADGAVPANNGALDPGVILDLGATEENTALEPDAITDDDTGADGHIRTNAAALADLGGGVDQDVSAVNVRLRRGGEELRVLLGEGGKVQAGAGKEVLGLTNIHPEALEVERVKLAILDHGGENLLLDGGRAELDPVEDGGVENVHAGVDSVTDELNGLLDEAVDQRSMTGLVDNDTILGRLLNLGDHDGTFLTVALVKLGELLEGEIADDIRVEHEEGLVVLSESLLGQL